MQQTKSGQQIIVSGNGATVFSDPFKTSLDGMTIVGQIRKTAGAGSAVLTLQGGWEDQGTDTNLWVDMDFTATTSSNLIVLMKTAGNLLETFDMFTWYRIKAVCTGIATVEARLLFLNH